MEKQLPPIHNEPGSREVCKSSWGLIRDSENPPVSLLGAWIRDLGLFVLSVFSLWPFHRGSNLRLPELPMDTGKMCNVQRVPGSRRQVLACSHQ